MASPTIKEVEDAVLAALTQALGADVKTIRSFQGDWREELRQGGMRLPGLLVMLKGSRAEQIGPGTCDLLVDFQVLAAVRDWRGDEASRREEGGLYDLMTGIREALWQQDLGLLMLPMMLVREEPLLSGPEFWVQAAHYRTTVVQDLVG